MSQNPQQNQNPGQRQGDDANYVSAPYVSFHLCALQWRLAIRLHNVNLMQRPDSVVFVRGSQLRVHGLNYTRDEQLKTILGAQPMLAPPRPAISPPNAMQHSLIRTTG